MNEGRVSGVPVDRRSPSSNLWPGVVIQSKAISLIGIELNRTSDTGLPSRLDRAIKPFDGSEKQVGWKALRQMV